MKSTHWKRPWCWERLKAGEEGDNRAWEGWMASPTQWTWVWASFKRWWRTGKPGCCSPLGHKESDTTEQLKNNSNPLHLYELYFLYKQVISVCMCVHAKSLLSCLDLYDPMYCSLPGIFQARKLEWVAMLSSRGSSWPRDQTHISQDSCISSGFFITCATWKALISVYSHYFPGFFF